MVISEASQDNGLSDCLLIGANNNRLTAIGLMTDDNARPDYLIEKSSMEGRASQISAT